jgi:uncharacterized protein (DUF169 family)
MEVNMLPLKTDMSIYKKFEFENPAVGIKYSHEKPEGIELLDKQLALCEMVKEAYRRNKPFYFTKENENCVGRMVLGMQEESPSASTGQIGVEFGIYQDARANRNVYRHQWSLEKGVVKYVIYSPVDQLTFEPDLMIIMATVPQAEIIMRAMSYSTGEIWSSQMAGVGACSWFYAYPFLTGKVNYTVTGLTFGNKAKEILPAGWMLIAIPFQWIPTITRNLNEMEWVLPAYTDGREKFFEREMRVIKDVSK